MSAERTTNCVINIPSTNGLVLRGLVSRDVKHHATLGPTFPVVVVYLHGFPDLSVHPHKPDFASRFPRKLMEDSLEAHPDWGFLCFNCSGIPGSSGRFQDKTLHQELADCVCVLQYIREQLLAPGADTARRIHVVGLSTGAILAALLAGQNFPDVTITTVAGLADLQLGVHLDFDEAQVAAFEQDDFCYKTFYLPRDCGRGTPGDWWATNVEVPSDSDPTNSTAHGDNVVRWRLDRPYYDSFFQLSIQEAVAGYSGPLLVVHGDADNSVPFTYGQALFEAAATTDKQFVAIPGGNHLLSSTKHFQKFSQAFRAFVKRLSTT